MSRCRLYVMPDPSAVVLYIGWPLYAVFIMRAFTMSGVSVGSFCSIRAAAPLTTGVAMLVPLRRKYMLAAPHDGLGHVATSKRGLFVSRVEPGSRNDTTRLPGATRSGLAMWSTSVGPLEL